MERIQGGLILLQYPARALTTKWDIVMSNTKRWVHGSGPYEFAHLPYVRASSELLEATKILNELDETKRLNLDGSSWVAYSLSLLCFSRSRHALSPVVCATTGAAGST